MWVDLDAVFRIRRPREHFEDRLDLQARVPGELLFWEKTTTGHWVGYVSFVMPKTHAGVRVSQLVMEYALSLREDPRARPEHRGNRSC